ncbi:hypothetical protein GGTG_05408 [Gaeumannomyces tritici R3-111a-1]|uniref:Rho-GAP domain-containing protein n=1 Tax=Gaeumannomyces tritici (strain R3-111a-1) TaxID=644352 RepID=J3NVU6_GAET3|nr:hypothetical protein GGTG_05408 [Gaeumannomyces tritici R3-111a-1]EJT75475.1 hypothetical protein GGTG_05408 [Gaeumannomyces tritici R3-111a-1]
MGRKPAPVPLTLSETTTAAAAAGSNQRSAGETQHTDSRTEPRSPKSPRSPRSPFRFTHKKSPVASISPSLQAPAEIQAQNQLSAQQPQQRQHQQTPQAQYRPQDESQYPLISSALEQPYQGLPEVREPPGLGVATSSQPADGGQAPSQPQGDALQLPSQMPSQRPLETPKSGFFFNFAKPSPSRPTADARRTEIMAKSTEHSKMTKQSHKHSESSHIADHIQRPLASLPSKSEVSLASSAEGEATTLPKRGKPKPFAILGRQRSLQDKENTSPKDKDAHLAPEAPTEPERAHTAAPPLRTAPAQSDRSFRDMMSSAVRNHSADRAERTRARGDSGRDKENHSSRDREYHHGRTHTSTSRENGGSAFLSGLKSSGSKAADIISKGLFGKGGRSGSTTEKEPIVDDEHYQLKVLNLPLRDQVRRTRISKRLEDSRDKTEFWMPAFPWRAIDYLNYKGTEVEGLYRVPGSGPQIKKWQRKFDEEYDVDLFNQKDLYDINIIGSMLKAWLRQLPDELFPKEAQERIAKECAGAEKVPPLLIEELSNLSPFNYYLLFAITCHLSLLLAHSDKNKMDFRNLCICFQPCMKIDAFCFKFLVCDWRDCWKGCKDEAKYIEEEYLLFDQPPPPGLSEPSSRKAAPRAEGMATGAPFQDVRLVSSSDSSKQSNQGEKPYQQTQQQPQQQLQPPKSRLTKKKTQPQPTDNGGVVSASTVPTLTIDSNPRETTPPRRSGDMRPLSPIKPLSPLGF